MNIRKLFKPAIVTLIALNITIVFLLASNKINEDKEVMAYMSEANNMLEDETRIQSALDTDSAVNVHIQANTDLGLRTEAAIVAQVGKKVIFTVQGMAQGDTLIVRGANDYIIPLETESYGEYKWVPDRSGIFEMVLQDRTGTERVARRINVTSKDRQEFYELTPVEYCVDQNNNVSFNTSIFNMPVNEGDNEAIPTTQFTIGESGIWTKTIKAYSTSKYAGDMSQTSIVEGKDFLLDRGHYIITASLKDLYSIDAQDSKSIVYKKEGADGHKVIIDDIEVVEEKNAEGIEVNHFVVKARCDHEGDEACDLVYAFFVEDVVGKKGITGTINGYTESNEITIPSIQWTYTLTVKVKHKHNSEMNEDSTTLLLPNAYEAVATKDIVNDKQVYNPIDIKDIRIQAALIDDLYNDKGLLPAQIIDDTDKTGTVYVGSNNYITINVGDNEDAQKLKFSAWVIDDGQTINLEPVYESAEDTIGNTFVYYPKTGGSNAYNKEKTSKIYIVVTEENGEQKVIRKAARTIEVNIK